MKIGLALSGGGVLCAAHLGVLRQLDKHNIKIDYICASSAGSIIGALFANGGITQIEKCIHNFKKCAIIHQKRFPIRPTPAKLFYEIRHNLAKYLRRRTFKQLSTKFSCIATNIETGKIEILQNGNVLDAVMASIAYPGIFPVQTIEGRHLVDGGVLKNLPASIVKKKVDFVIGSLLRRSVKFSIPIKKHGFFARLSIASRAIDIIQQELIKHEKTNCNFLFQPKIQKYHIYDLAHLDEIIKIGEGFAQKNIQKLLIKLEKYHH